MTKLLLDFPWQLEAVLDPSSEPSSVLLAFDQLCDKEHLKRLPFVREDEYFALLRRPGRTVQHVALQALAKCVRKAGAGNRGFSVAGPNDQSDHWQFALHDELLLQEWRTPQIIIQKERLNLWKNSIVGQRRTTEALLRLEHAAEEHRRVIAILGSYDDHLYACSDRIPWDLQRRRVPDPTAPERLQRPCTLPMPPSLKKVRFEDIRPEVEKIRNWEINGKYYYLPRADWRPNDIGKQAWREGHTFPHQACPHCGKKWAVDRYSQIWCWDENERHWDVQLRGKYYWSISYDGTFLKSKRKSTKKKKGRRGK
jgi:hypothetical protein